MKSDIIVYSLLTIFGIYMIIKSIPYMNEKRDNTVWGKYSKINCDDKKTNTGCYNEVSYTVNGKKYNSLLLYHTVPPPSVGDNVYLYYKNDPSVVTDFNTGYNSLDLIYGIANCIIGILLLLLSIFKLYKLYKTNQSQIHNTI